MKQIIAAAFLGLGILSSGKAIAAERTVTLRVENMYCASCPYIVEQTLAGVPGVDRVEISYQADSATAMAVVIYEDRETNADALTTATSDIGFPSTVVQ